jgi:nucleoside-diphosphate-sugar epimerase
MITDRILIIGANGQVGTALLPQLQLLYGINNVIATDLHHPQPDAELYERLDATKMEDLAAIVLKYKITQIYHLAAILSAKGEADPVWAWNLNMQTMLNVFEVARTCDVKKVFLPSSIAVFGKSAQRDNTQQQTYLDPSTIYGVSKVAAENWSAYYHQRFGLDIRSVRYPGVISYQSMPGGGTTDYAVEIYHKALANEDYTCYLRENTRLPMIYIDDALRATIELMEAPAEQITVRSSYNLAGLSFTPVEIYQEIQKHYPDFKCDFKPDFRQNIANSWPQSIDDSAARQDWGWKPAFDLNTMTVDMFAHLSPVLTGK